MDHGVGYLCRVAATLSGQEKTKRHPFIDRVLVEGEIQEQVENDSNPLAGIEDEPLLPLHEIGVGLSSIFGAKFIKFVNEALSLSQNPLDRLTTNESAAIRLYTMDTELYSRLNKILRNRKCNELKCFFPYLKLFYTALFKLPWCASNQLLWRGINCDLREQMKEKDSITWWQITSCSKLASIAGIFGGFSSDQWKNFFTRSLLIIETSFAKNITNHSYFKNEQELILLSGTTLKISSVAEDSSTAIYHLHDYIPPKQLLVDSFQDIKYPVLPKGPWSEEQMKSFLGQRYNPDEWIYLQDHTINEANLCTLANQYELGEIQWPKLSLWDNSFDYRCAPHIYAILKTNCLVCFNIGTNCLGNRGAACLEALRYCDKLTELSLWNNQIDDDGLRYLISEVSKTRLKILNLGTNKITDIGLKNLLPPLPKTIEDLDLFSNQITNKSLNIIEDAFQNRQNLRILIMDGTNPIWQVSEHRQDLINKADKYHRLLKR